MPETADQKKRREQDEMLAALRKNQTKVPTAEEGSETYQEGEGQGYGTRTRRTLKMPGASPSPGPGPSPSPSSAAGQAKTLRSPGASSYDSMSDSELEAAARSSVMAAAALQRRKKTKAGGQ